MNIEEKARALFLVANESDCPDRDEASCLRVTKCLCGSSIAAIATALRDARNAALEEAAMLVSASFGTGFADEIRALKDKP